MSASAQRVHSSILTTPTAQTATVVARYAVGRQTTARSAQYQAVTELTCWAQPVISNVPNNTILSILMAITYVSHVIRNAKHVTTGQHHVDLAM